MSVFVTGGQAPEKINYVPYIESSGTQFFDTEVMGKTGITVEIDFEQLTGNTVDLIVAGCAGFAYNPRFYIVAAQSGKIAYGYGEWVNSTTTFSLNKRYKVKTVLQSGRQGLTVNGVSVLTGTDSTTYSAGYTMHLFGANLHGTHADYGKQRLYSCQIWEGDALVRDLWPCYDPSGIACLYDKVEGKYYYNAGTGQFIAG